MAYVHGYEPRENLRLQDQAATLTHLLHHDTFYPGGSTVLEAGCGVGGQTVVLARNSPGACITAVDISAESLAQARDSVRRSGCNNVAFLQADIFDLPFAEGTFDHVFVCFLLEHLRSPVEALRSLKRVLTPGGTLTVIEGDHGSTYFTPHSEFAYRAIACLIELQRRAGGDAHIGRELGPLITEADFLDVRVSRRQVHVDGNTRDLREGFVRRTFTPMVEGIRDATIAAGLMDPAAFDRGIADLYRAADPDGTFRYTFFKGTGRRAPISAKRRPRFERRLQL